MTKETQITKNDIKEAFPLHYFVWEKDEDGLKEYLNKNPKAGKEKDNHGRTALMMAVALDHVKEARILATANPELVVISDDNGIYPWQEVITSSDDELIEQFIVIKERMRFKQLLKQIRLQINDFLQGSDFFYQIKWKFSGWGKFLQRGKNLNEFTYFVYKRGSKIRIDTKLIQIDDDHPDDDEKANKHSFDTGNRSYIFANDENGASFFELNRTAGKKTYRELRLNTEGLEKLVLIREPIKDQKHHEMKCTWLETSKMKVKVDERGVLYKNVRTQVISRYTCKVYNVSKVYLNVNIRQDHVDRTNYENNGISPVDRSAPSAPVKRKAVDMVKYFSNREEKYDIGIERQVLQEKSHFSGKIFYSDAIPLNTQSHLLPVLKMMALLNPNFDRIISFVNGADVDLFPMKFECPIFFALHAEITIENVFAQEGPVHGVKTNRDRDKVIGCTINDDLFIVQPGYTLIL